jgi:hypothetical protein
MLPAMTIRVISQTQPTPAAPAPICELLDAGHKVFDVVIDTEPGLRDIERLGLRMGVALLHAWLKPANCASPS